MLDDSGAEQGGDGVEDAHVYPVGEEEEHVAPVGKEVLHGGDVRVGLAQFPASWPLALGAVGRAGRLILEHWKTNQERSSEDEDCV